MKLNFKLIIVFVFFLLTGPACYAKDYVQNYIVRNTATDILYDNILQNINKQNPEKIIANNNSFTIYIFDDEKYTYLRIYKNAKDSELFVVSNEKENRFIENIKTSQKDIYYFNDKSYEKLRKKDLKDFALQNKIETIKVKTQKTKDSAIPVYNPYKKKLRNKKLETIALSQNNINIERKKLLPKAKVKHYSFAYEYLITNNTGKPITIKNVASQDFIGLSQIAAYAAIPRGKDFIPVYNIIYGIQTDIEKNRFTRPLPVNLKIENNQMIRILALAKKEIDPKVDFVFLVEEKDFVFKFNNDKGNSL